MFILKISMLEGRTDEKKAELIRRLTDAAAQHLGAEAAEVRCIIYDVPPSNWGAGGVSIQASRQNPPNNPSSTEQK